MLLESLAREAISIACKMEKMTEGVTVAVMTVIGETVSGVKGGTIAVVVLVEIETAIVVTTATIVEVETAIDAMIAKDASDRETEDMIESVAATIENVVVATIENAVVETETERKRHRHLASSPGPSLLDHRVPTLTPSQKAWNSLKKEMDAVKL